MVSILSLGSKASEVAGNGAEPSVRWFAYHLKPRSWLALSENFLQFSQIVVACRLNPCKVRYLKVKQNSFSADLVCAAHGKFKK